MCAVFLIIVLNSAFGIKKEPLPYTVVVKKFEVIDKSFFKFFGYKHLGENFSRYFANMLYLSGIFKSVKYGAMKEGDFVIDGKVFINSIPFLKANARLEIYLKKNDKCIVSYSSERIYWLKDGVAPVRLITDIISDMWLDYEYLKELNLPSRVRCRSIEFSPFLNRECMKYQAVEFASLLGAGLSMKEYIKHDSRSSLGLGDYFVGLFFVSAFLHYLNYLNICRRDYQIPPVSRYSHFTPSFECVVRQLNVYFNPDGHMGEDIVLKFVKYFHNIGLGISLRNFFIEDPAGEEYHSFFPIIIKKPIFALNLDYHRLFLSSEVNLLPPISNTHKIYANVFIEGLLNFLSYFNLCLRTGILVKYNHISPYFGIGLSIGGIVDTKKYIKIMLGESEVCGAKLKVKIKNLSHEKVERIVVFPSHFADGVKFSPSYRIIEKMNPGEEKAADFMFLKKKYEISRVRFYVLNSNLNTIDVADYLLNLKNVSNKGEIYFRDRFLPKLVLLPIHRNPSYSSLVKKIIIYKDFNARFFSCVDEKPYRTFIAGNTRNKFIIPFRRFSFGLEISDFDLFEFRLSAMVYNASLNIGRLSVGADYRGKLMRYGFIFDANRWLCGVVFTQNSPHFQFIFLPSEWYNLILNFSPEPSFDFYLNFPKDLSNFLVGAEFHKNYWRIKINIMNLASWITYQNILGGLYFEGGRIYFNIGLGIGLGFML